MAAMWGIVTCAWLPLAAGSKQAHERNMTALNKALAEAQDVRRREASDRVAVQAQLASQTVGCWPLFLFSQHQQRGCRGASAEVTGGHHTFILSFSPRRASTRTYTMSS